jgi:hypothetical protein
MRNCFWLQVSCVWLGAALIACGGGGGGAECALDTDCPVGRYCSAGACVFDCALDGQCAQGYRCDPARGRCVAGCVPSNGGLEACDGVDNDCDGLTDEAFPRLGTACQNGACAPGVWACAQDGQTDRCTGPLPAADDPTCDGRDEDCDGTTDEDAPPQACPLQQGVCLGASAACTGGGYPACDYGPSFTPDTDATCDHLDSDCDGSTDEDALRLEPEAGAQAGDGLDNNCNGLVDEPGGVLVPIPGAPGVWIDAYESSVFAAADCTGTPYGQDADDYPADWPAEGEATGVLYACSLAGAVPSGYLSWYRAKRACEAQGKRLCDDEEWNSACADVALSAFPYGSTFMLGVCNDALGGTGQVAACGAHPGCVTPGGAADMSGNLAEWLADPDPGSPGRYKIGGFHYLCEFCTDLGCLACDLSPESDDRHDAIAASDCYAGVRAEETLRQGYALPYLGGRCCKDGP